MSIGEKNYQYAYKYYVLTVLQYRMCVLLLGISGTTIPCISEQVRTRNCYKGTHGSLTLLMLMFGVQRRFAVKGRRRRI